MSRSLSVLPSSLQVHGKPTYWSMWEEAYDFDKRYSLRIHPKLTADHLHLSWAEKMRNHLAVEVLNNDMLRLFQVIHYLAVSQLMFLGKISDAHHEGVK